MGNLFLAQPAGKFCAAFGTVGGFKSAAVSKQDTPGNSQAQTRAAALGGAGYLAPVERLKKMG